MRCTGTVEEELFNLTPHLWLLFICGLFIGLWGNFLESIRSVQYIDCDISKGYCCQPIIRLGMKCVTWTRCRAADEISFNMRHCTYVFPLNWVQPADVEIFFLLNLRKLWALSVRLLAASVLYFFSTGLRSDTQKEPRTDGTVPLLAHYEDVGQIQQAFDFFIMLSYIFYSYICLTHFKTCFSQVCTLIWTF